jgi:hypothetical protein
MHSILGAISVPIIRWLVIFVLTDLYYYAFFVQIALNEHIYGRFYVSSSRYFSMRTSKQIVIKFDIHHYRWQDSPFWATTFHRRFYQIASGFYFFGFCDKFFTDQGCQPCFQLPALTKFLYLCPPVTGWPSYTPRHQVLFLFLQFARLQWRYSNPAPHWEKFDIRDL